MRAGTSAGTSAAAAAAAGSPQALQPAPAAALVIPTEARSWRAAVRCGLAALIAGEVPLARVRHFEKCFILRMSVFHA